MRTSAEILDVRRFDPANEAPAPVPPLLRRRLSPLGRAAAAALLSDGPLGEAAHDPETAWVYASRWGDLTRALEELRSLATGGGVSPAHFATSVHNGVEAVLSIAAKHTGPETAVAGGPFTLEAAFAAAIPMLSSSKRVVVLAAEEDLEHPEAAEGKTPFAAAVLLGPAPADAFSGLACGGPETAPRLVSLFSRPRRPDETLEASIESLGTPTIEATLMWLEEPDASPTRRVVADRFAAYEWARIGTPRTACSRTSGAQQ